ncbi:nuclease SbcCD subunit C [Polaribacter sp. ALD11]|uniref:AAA family ATPase n=1 Tax=Polaribacter sp. ALD11 TaxID=2058137 RepID=UPI000C30537F|nr:AAA family ATPase [Polaribacter sp. ALD11]AUC84183.1 nuclease SbcCD subunit C [Polaribacter sp. ALD11]
MKILKIELQNINSLKSDFPIVIDFENEQFKDVGLYAITGATGAGKTTILDAITVALYHNVPRFNNTKGTLLDVVSHGANEAFSRVTFENNNLLYETFWGIRVADKSGKKYKNSKEEVSLKNLTTNTILATQKRLLINEIISVTQLDYNQFLRSVMLAQGEFASFLTAKGPEKGKLLEQITGEQIYKKIGQGILDRKSEEEKKLKEIQARINSDDVLTEENKIELSQKDKILNADIVTTEKDIKSIQFVVDWYLKFQDLNTKSEILDQNAKSLSTYIENHKEELDLLAANEKAAPFKECIQNLNKTKKEATAKALQLKALDEELTQLKPAIERLEITNKQEKTAVENADKEFSSWLPKFDLVTNLDGELKNEIDKKQKAVQNLETLTREISLLKVEEKNLAKELTETTSKIKNEEIFIAKNSFLKEVATEISNWASALTSLKANKETLKIASEFSFQKKKEVLNTTATLQENKKILDHKIAEIKIIEKEISAIAVQLTEHTLTTILAEEKKLSVTEANWKQFKNFSELIIKEEKELQKIAAQKKLFSTDLETTTKQIEVLKKEIATQEKSVLDADKILTLERSISKYEDDRKHLIEGEACSLCGSEEHPFAEHLDVIGVSKSELELQTRKNTLKKLTDSKAELEKTEVKLTTSIQSFTQQTTAISEELKAIQQKATQLPIDCKLRNTTKIVLELQTVSEQLKLIAEKIKVTQNLLAKKDALAATFKEQNQSVGKLQNTVATLQEKIKNTTTEIEVNQKSMVDVTKKCTDLESDLKTKLSKFNYEVPAIDNTNIFIKEIENLIANFHKKQQDVNALKATLTVIHTKSGNTTKQLATHAKTETEYRKTITDANLKSIALKTKRIAILPIDISVTEKREQLQKVSKQATEKLEASKIAFQKLLDSKKEKEVLKIKHNEDHLLLVQEIAAIKLALFSEMKNSDFETIESIEKALLPKELAVKYTENKERIKENQLKLKTLREENLKAKSALNKAKNFETSEVESKLASKDLKLKRDQLSTEKGKIAEAFRKDQEIKDRNLEVYKKIEAQEQVCTIWRELFKIIGNSKDAFNVYVQRLTLTQLLDLANVHLYKLNKRYSLKMEDEYKPKEELNFNLIDHYQTDQARLVDTSSGGEKFIISLALALGLSDLASKNVKIDSLFIDEGFGTLDKNTLETVISTLETLQSQGKMIGIISHVENLKERIPTQIQITKKSNGVSVVDIV